MLVYIPSSPTAIIDAQTLVPVEMTGVVCRPSSRLIASFTFDDVAVSNLNCGSSVDGTGGTGRLTKSFLATLFRPPSVNDFLQKKDNKIRAILSGDSVY